jgi:transposase-like protein
MERHMKLVLHPAINMAWLAREVGVNRSTVARWVAGTRNIPNERISQVAGVLMTMMTDTIANSMLEINDEDMGDE